MLVYLIFAMTLYLLPPKVVLIGLAGAAFMLRQILVGGGQSLQHCHPCFSDGDRNVGRARGTCGSRRHGSRFN